MKLQQLLLATAVLVSAGSFAQKDEMKVLKRIYDKDTPTAKDITEYQSTLVKAEPLVANSTESDKVYFAYYKSIAPMLDLALPENQKNPQIALKIFTPTVLMAIGKASNDVVEFEKKSGKKILTDDIIQSAKEFSPQIINYAVAIGGQKQEKEASQVLYALYLMDKTQVDNLYFAASYAVNGQDYDNAMAYYKELKALNYSGEKTVYEAKSKISDKYEPFPSKSDRDIAVKLGTHVLPKEEKEPSKKGEIYKNMVLILNQQGKTEEAKAAIADAIKENPNDISVLMAEDDLYLKLKDNDGYKRVVAEIIQKDPNNADMIYNLGVVSLEAGQYDEAEKYFKRVLEIKPDYANAYVNLTVIKLKADKSIVEQMNKLSTSAADNKKYEQLKAQRTQLFNAVLPDLEKAYQLAPDNDSVIDNLLSVYNFLEMSDKRKALKAKTGR
jgi:tetratricopeptide (TPR) repeat protein